jgi:hypothetical protein
MEARGREVCPAFLFDPHPPFVPLLNGITFPERKTTPPTAGAVSFLSAIRAGFGDKTRMTVNEGNTAGEIAPGGAPPTRETGCGCRDARKAPLDPVFLAENCHHSRNGFTM